MSLNDKDKAAVKDLWAKISKASDEIGADTVGRLLTVYPQTKIYFRHWESMEPGSAPVKAHGKKVMKGMATAVKNIDDLRTGLLDLSEQHAFKIKVDPANFKLLAQCFQVVISNKFPKDFPPEVHVSFDKFMAAVALGLSERYR